MSSDASGNKVFTTVDVSPKRKRKGEPIAEKKKPRRSRLQQECQNLPHSFQHALSQYERLDGALCFLLKNKMNPTLTTLSTFLKDMSEDLGNAIEDACSARKLVTSFTGPAAGDVLSLHWVPCERVFHELPLATDHMNGRLRPQSNYRLEVLFTRIAGTGAGNSKRRVKKVKEAILLCARTNHRRFLNVLATWHSFVSCMIRREENGQLNMSAATKCAHAELVEKNAYDNGGWHPEWRWSAGGNNAVDGKFSLCSATSSTMLNSIRWPGFEAVEPPLPPPDYEEKLSTVDLPNQSDNNTPSRQSEDYTESPQSRGQILSLHHKDLVNSPSGNVVSTDPYRLPPAPLDGDRAVTGAHIEPLLLRRMPHDKNGGLIKDSSGYSASQQIDVTKIVRCNKDQSESEDIDPHLVLKALKSLPFYRGQDEEARLGSAEEAFQIDEPSMDLINRQNREVFNDEGQVKHVEVLPARNGRYVEFEDLPFLSSRKETRNDSGMRLLPAIEKALRSCGVEKLFEHQAEALSAALSPERKHVIISTGTSSGKSVVYNVPVVQSIIEAKLEQSATTESRSNIHIRSGSERDKEYTNITDDSSMGPCALYLFPTKALSQDQLGALEHFLAALPKKNTSSSTATLSGSTSKICDIGKFVKPFVVDGDTPHMDRNRARLAGNVIMTNPDMLHITLLPQHRQWRRFLRSLRWVVIDEAHTYKGIFGSHVAAVLRRLVRLCRTYSAGNESNAGLQFIYCSATISNPCQHFAQLVPLHVLGGIKRLAAVTSDTAPRGEKLLVFWNPPKRRFYHNSRFDTTNKILPEPVDTGMKVAAAAKSKASEKSLYFTEEEAPGSSHKQLNYQTSDKAAFDSIWTSSMSTETTLTEASNAQINHSRQVPVIRTAGGSFRHVRIEDKKKEGGTGLSSTRTSTIVETARLLTSLVKRGVRTLVFSRTRKLTELVLRYSLQDLHATAPQLVSLVRGYRGGYTKEERRAIEKDLFREKLLGVAATCALELGIDVGSLDATLHMGFPGSMSSLWQQAGRAGRGGRRSLAILICFDSPLDQLFCLKPATLLSRPAETAVVPNDNTLVLRGQLLCAAKEAPLRFSRSFHHASSDYEQEYSKVEHNISSHIENIQICSKQHAFKYGHQRKLDVDDGVLFGYGATAETVCCLLQEGAMTAVTTRRILKASESTQSSEARGIHDFCCKSSTKIVQVETVCHCHPSIESPAHDKANLRMIDPLTITVVDTTQPEGSGEEGLGGREIDSIGYSRAFYELFEGAIYLHQARQYLVTRLDIPGIVSSSSTSSNSGINSRNSNQNRPRALVRPVRVNYYTSSRNHTDIDVTKKLESGLGAGNILSTGCVNVVSRVWGWRKHWAGSGRIAEMGQFSLPPLEYSTRAVWIDVPSELRRDIEANSLQQAPSYAVEQKSTTLECEGLCGGCNVEAIETPRSKANDTHIGDDNVASHTKLIDLSERSFSNEGQRDKKTIAMCDPFLAALHGLNHVIVAVAPLFVLCEPEDIATEHVYPFQVRPRPHRVIIFDKRPGGIGVSEALFQCMPAVLAKAHEVIKTCPCDGGCPACVFDGKCTNHNAIIDKRGAMLLAEGLVNFICKDCDNRKSEKNRKSSSCAAQGGNESEDVDTVATETLDSTNDLLEASPRRAQRFRTARAMDNARKRGSAVRGPWTNALMPDFQSMFD